jgi:hypothetical protein
MTASKDESSDLKKILNIGEDDLVTHKGDSENSRLTVKSSTSLRGVKSQREFVSKYK